MPKMKTNSGAGKRFTRTGTGKLKRRRTNRNHILTKKPTKRKRQVRAMGYVKACDFRAMDRMV